MGPMASRSRWNRVRAALNHAGLLLALAAYTAIGGLVFRALEEPAEASRLHALQIALLAGRRDLVVAVVDKAAASSNCTVRDHARNDLHAELQRDFERRLHAYETLVHEASRGGVEVPALTATPSAETPTRWSLVQGMFFASTVLTTIGYGNIAPVTMWGRVFCLLFALIGIPFTLSVIADLGVLLASAVSALPCWSRCRTRWSRDDGGSKGMCCNGLLALGAVLLLFVYLAAGSAMFLMWEDNWDFFDGFYFCFITMTTIGFGDLVPRHPSYSLLCTVYILVGLAFTSTIIELVRRQYASSWRRLQEALSESGPALGDVLRRLGTVPDMKGIPKGILAAVSMARLVPQGGVHAHARPVEVAVDAQREWEEALAAVLREMEEKSMKEMETKREKEKERRRKERERQRRRDKKEGKVIEIIIYETTV